VHYDEQRRTLERFVAERGDRLLHTAALLAGSRADGEDLLQSALERLLRHWRRIDGDPENYVRRTLYNLAADGWRRQRVRQRKAVLFEPAPPVDPATAVDLRDAVVRVLVRLPPRQRAVFGVALLRAAERGGNGGSSRLLGGHGEIGGRLCRSHRTLPPEHSSGTGTGSGGSTSCAQAWACLPPGR
jgi:RNA polymerase sigma factor (sigma-70 family)